MPTKDRKHKNRRNKCKKRISKNVLNFKHDMFAILGKLKEKPLSVVLVWQEHGQAWESYAVPFQQGAFSCGNKHVLQGQVTMHLRTTLRKNFFFNDFVSRLPTLQNRCPHSPFLLSPSPQWSVYSLLNPVDVFTVFNHHDVTMSPMSSQYPCQPLITLSSNRPFDPS